MKQVAIVDFSWAMYASRFGFRDLTISRQVNGAEVVHPIGHIYGTLVAINMLSRIYPNIRSDLFGI
jgi:hypothetical protein